MPTVFSKEIEQPPDKELERRKSIKAVGKSAQGNQHKFPQQSQFAKKQSSSDTAPSILDHDYFVKDDIRRDITNLTDCCAKGRGIFGGCLLKHFGYHHQESISSSSSSSSSSVVDQSREDAVEAATEYVKINRAKGFFETKTKREKRDPFIQEIFRECILSTKQKKSNRTEGCTISFEMQYLIPSVDNRLGRNNRIEVCVKTLQCVYGISAHEWRICNEQLRETDSGRLSTLRHKPWEDDHLHDYTLAEVENVFLRNLIDTPIASKYTTIKYFTSFIFLFCCIVPLLQTKHRFRYGKSGNNSFGRVSKECSYVDERLFQHTR
jgi:hypothetical protein